MGIYFTCKKECLAFSHLANSLLGGWGWEGKECYRHSTTGQSKDSTANEAVSIPWPFGDPFGSGEANKDRSGIVGSGDWP